MQCWSCSKTVPDNSNFCLHCGENLRDRNKQSREPSNKPSSQTDVSSEQPKHKTISRVLQTIGRNYHEPKDEIKAKDAIAKSIAARLGQQKFRKCLLCAYDFKCAITEFTAEEVLEAAHIQPYSSGGTFHVTNGILLRADLHTLFDLGLIAIDVEYMTVLIHSSLEDTQYKSLKGKLLNVPNDKEKAPNKIALDIHRKESGL